MASLPPSALTLSLLAVTQVISYQMVGGPESPAGLATITCASNCAHESTTVMLTYATGVVGCLSKYVHACRRKWWRYLGVTDIMISNVVVKINMRECVKKVRMHCREGCWPQAVTCNTKHNG